jgi:hypothetical protein
MQGGLQQLEIVGGRLLGEFDHHLAGRNAEVAQQLQGTPGWCAAPAGIPARR